MVEAPENGKECKESSYSAHANAMNEWIPVVIYRHPDSLQVKANLLRCQRKIP
jgi:hypothetical protein